MPVFSLSKPAQGLISDTLIAALILAGYAALAVLAPPSAARRILDFTSPLWSLIAAGCLLQAARRTRASSARLGLAWYILAAALLTHALGDLAWGILQDVLGQPPFPSIADAFYLAYYPLFLIAILRLPSRPFSRLEGMKTYLDIYIILLAAILVFWNFLLGPVYLTGSGEPFWNLALSLAYPVGDLALLYCVLMLLYREPEEQSRPVVLALAAAAGITFITDFIFCFQSIRGTYSSGSLLEVGWIAAYLLYALAGLRQAGPWQGLRAGMATAAPQPWRRERWVAYLPYAWLSLAFLMLIASYYWAAPMGFGAMAVCVGAIIALVLARQILTMRENSALLARLNNALEQVRQQALELSRANRDLQTEIGERIDAQEQLAYSALHDPLTSLPNRSLLMDRLGRAVEQGLRQKDYRCALLYLDVDQFKAVNDRLGHSAGDELLGAFARRLHACLRTVDTVARFGGDEFVILLEDLRGPEDAVECARRILEQMEAPFTLKGQSLTITTSIGIVTDFRGYAGLDGIIHDADTAMYQAKMLGKARYEIFAGGP